MHTSLYQTLADITLNLFSYFNVPFDHQYNGFCFFKILAYNRVAGYLFCTERTIIHIIISSIICHVRFYQIFPDITLNLVTYLYLWLSPKFWHIKRDAGYLFFTGRIIIHIIVSSIIATSDYTSNFPNITLTCNLVSYMYLYLLIINILFFPNILAY